MLTLGGLGIPAAHPIRYGFSTQEAGGETGDECEIRKYRILRSDLEPSKVSSVELLLEDLRAPGERIPSQHVVSLSGSRFGTGHPSRPSQMCHPRPT